MIRVGILSKAFCGFHCRCHAQDSLHRLCPASLKRGIHRKRHRMIVKGARWWTTASAFQEGPGAFLRTRHEWFLVAIQNRNHEEHLLSEPRKGGAGHAFEQKALLAKVPSVCSVRNTARTTPRSLLITDDKTWDWRRILRLIDGTEPRLCGAKAGQPRSLYYKLWPSRRGG